MSDKPERIPNLAKTCRILSGALTRANEAYLLNDEELRAEIAGLVAENRKLSRSNDMNRRSSVKYLTLFCESDAELKRLRELVGEK